MATYRQICDDLQRERRLRLAAEREASALAAKVGRAESEVAKMQAEIDRLTAALVKKVSPDAKMAKQAAKDKATIEELAADNAALRMKLRRATMAKTGALND